MVSYGCSRLNGTVTIVLVLTALILSSFARADASVSVLIDGVTYPAKLRDNTQLLGRVLEHHALHARHYEGELTGIDGSWIRVSNIRGHWQGVVSLEGSRYVINSRAHTGTADALLEASPPSEIMNGESCATQSPVARSVPLAAELSAGTASADLANVCQSKVNGICLLAELDLAFDLLFQQQYPDTFQDEGVALLNIVDGYYRNDLHIQFDAMSMTFLTNDLFDTTTDANALLTDISDKKNAGSVPFVKNPRAILHLVTGRNFNTNTVGIANVGSLCAPLNNTGTSQIASGSIPLTALVVAHEIGHNFGAQHDSVDNACADNQFIMSAILDPSATHFSSCSIDEMTTRIDGLTNLGACFEYPVDAALIARPGNPTTATANENVTLGYDLTEQYASVAGTDLHVTGSFSTTGGTFIAATLNNLPCTLSPDAQSYSCAVGSSGGAIDVTARLAGGVVTTVAASVAVGADGNVKDIDPSNDTVSQSIATSIAPIAPTALTASLSGAAVRLTWQDNGGDENGFRLERRAGSGTWSQIATTAADTLTYTDTAVASGTTYEYRVFAYGPGGTSASSPTASIGFTTSVAASNGGGGGGGGGSSGIELVPLLWALFALRRRAVVR